MSVPGPIATEPVSGDDATVAESITSYAVWRDGRPTPARERQTWDTLGGAAGLVRWGWLPTEPTGAGADVARDAFGRFSVLIADAFPGKAPRVTPGATGCELLAGSLPTDRAAGRAERGVPYVTLPEQALRLVKATSPQNRSEVFAHHPGTIGQVRVYDSRVAYLACCEWVPVLNDVADLRHDDGDAIDPGRWGRYRIDVTVPAWWHTQWAAGPAWGLGLIHRPVTRDSRATWDWPTRPLTSWETWADARDLALLDRWEWSYAIRERVLFGSHTGAGADPLRLWAGRLRRLIETVEREPPSPTTAYLRAYLRITALHAIGKFAQVDRHERRELEPAGDLPPGDGWRPQTHTDGTLYAQRTRSILELGGLTARWCHPEWAAAIWSAARRRVLAKLIELPPAARLAIVGDDVYVADHTPDWPDDGKVGRFRLKRTATFGTTRLVIRQGAGPGHVQIAVAKASRHGP